MRTLAPTLARIAPRMRVHAQPRAPGRRAASSSTSTPAGPCTKYAAPTHTFHESPLIARAHEYLLPVYARPPFVLARGRGSRVWDTDGQSYVDFSAGIAVNALGHADAAFVDALREQAGQLLHTSNVYHNEWAGRLAELLVTLTQREGGLGFAPGVNGGGAKVFFSNSGTEANEGAIKIARATGKARWAEKTGRAWDDAACSKTRIACFAGGFHGRTMGALSVTTNAKYQKPFAPLLPGVDVGTLNDYAGLSDLVGEDTCAVIVEAIQGEGGINVAETAWLEALRKRCDEVGAVLIFDEIQCGLYRTGTLWAHSALPVACHPDMITMAKPLANGYPIGAVLMRDSVAAAMGVGTHGTTFGGSPLACALGHHVLSRLSDKTFVAGVAAAAAHLEARLERLAGWFPEVLEATVRGRGLIRGLGFKQAADAGRVVELARARGVFLLTAGQNAVRLVPSLNVAADDIDLAVDVIEGCVGGLGK